MVDGSAAGATYTLDWDVLGNGAYASTAQSGRDAARAYTYVDIPGDVTYTARVRVTAVVGGVTYTSSADYPILVVDSANVTDAVRADKCIEGCNKGHTHILTRHPAR